MLLLIVYGIHRIKTFVFKCNTILQYSQILGTFFVYFMDICAKGVSHCSVGFANLAALFPLKRMIAHFVQRSCTIRCTKISSTNSK